MEEVINAYMLLHDISEIKKPLSRHECKNNIKIGHRGSIFLFFIASRPAVGSTQPMGTGGKAAGA
jgi:hypothetical protein